MQYVIKTHHRSSISKISKELQCCVYLHLNRFDFIVLKRLAPEIDCNGILLKVILLLTLHDFQPKNVQKNICHRPRYGDIGVLNLCEKCTPLDFS